MQPLRIRHHERPVGSCRKGRLGGICEVNSLVGKTLDNVQANGVPDVENLVQILALDIEYQLEIEQARLCDDWVRSVNQSLAEVSASVEEAIRELGPNLDTQKDPNHGVPHFILTI